MKPSRIQLSIHLALSLAFCINTGFTAASQTISGVISGMEEDDGTVTELYLIVDIAGSEVPTQYFIKNKGVGKELFDYLYETASVTGIISEDKTGRKFIEVKKYEIMVIESPETEIDETEAAFDDESEQ